MTRVKVHHLNCVIIESPVGSAIGHCLLVENGKDLVLIDAGIGLLESQEPEKQLGKELIETTGFKFDVNLTAIRQIERLGFDRTDVKHIICSHLDPDHIGGLADFPKAKVHVSLEEFESFQRGESRYLPRQMNHKPNMELYKSTGHQWFGLDARKIDIGQDYEAYFIPLFGHTKGHCGVAINANKNWIFYAGDAYYLRAELITENHPIDQLATIRAVDNEERLNSLKKVRGLIQNHGHEIEYFGYHDPVEYEPYS